MTEIEAIKARHSVRTYQPKQIEAEKVEKLKALIEECNKEGNLHLQLCEDAGNSFNRLLHRATGLGTAPSCIACVGPDDETLDERIGYFGEKIVLFAQTLGLNTCWVGLYNKKEGAVPAEISEGERLSIVIAIGYGLTQGKERKSKTADQVVAGNSEKPDWFNYGIKMALLAPTAINQQQFEFVLNDDETVEVIDKGGHFSQVDKGIVKYHFEVGAASAKGVKG